MIVIDASALYEVIVEDDPTQALFESVAGERIFAPEIVDLEVLTALRRHVNRGGLELGRAAMAVASLETIPLIRSSHEPFLHRIWELRDNLSAYDASYVALAEFLEVPLLTLDKKMAASPGPTCEFQVISPPR